MNLINDRPYIDGRDENCPHGHCRAVQQHHHRHRANHSDYDHADFPFGYDHIHEYSPRHDPADDTTGIVEAVHAEAARLQAEDEEERCDAVFDALIESTIVNFSTDNVNIRNLARAILTALDGV